MGLSYFDFISDPLGELFSQFSTLTLYLGASPMGPSYHHGLILGPLCRKIKRQA
jgi:hypothetical protein